MNIYSSISLSEEFYISFPPILTFIIWSLFQSKNKYSNKDEHQFKYLWFSYSNSYMCSALFSQMFLVNNTDETTIWVFKLYFYCLIFPFLGLVIALLSKTIGYKKIFHNVVSTSIFISILLMESLPNNYLNVLNQYITPLVVSYSVPVLVAFIYGAIINLIIIPIKK